MIRFYTYRKVKNCFKVTYIILEKWPTAPSRVLEIWLNTLIHYKCTLVLFYCSKEPRLSHTWHRFICYNYGNLQKCSVYLFALVVFFWFAFFCIYKNMCQCLTDLDMTKTNKHRLEIKYTRGYRVTLIAFVHQISNGLRSTLIHDRMWSLRWLFTRVVLLVSKIVNNYFVISFKLMSYILTGSHDTSPGYRAWKMTKLHE